MKAITQLAVFALASTLLVSSAFGNTLEGWSDDFKQAFKEAKKQNKPVLVEFTGSDWCPPCIYMRENVFSKKGFVDAASKDFILVELDFPKHGKEPNKKNIRFAKKHKVSGYPTIVLFDSEGVEFTRFLAARYATTEKFLAHLKASLEADRG